MKPEKQSIPITFTGGLDTKTDPWQVGPSEFLVLNNMISTVGGRLTKRNGFGSLGKTINAPNPALTYSNVGASLTSARKLFAFQDELLLNDPFNLYSYDEANNAWNYKGRSTMVALKTESIISGVNTWLEADSSIDTTTGIKVFAFAGVNGVRYTIQDAATGQFLVNQALFGLNYTNPRCVSIAGKSWVLAVNTSDNNLYYQAIVGQTVTGGLVPLIANLNATSRFYDIDVDSHTGNIYIAYFNNGPGLTISAVSSSMTIGNTLTNGDAPDHGISWFGDGTNIWVVYNDGAATRAFIVNNAVTAVVLASTIVDNSALAVDVNNVTGVWSAAQGVAFIFYDPITIASQLAGGYVITAAINFNTLTASGTPGTPNLFMGSVSLGSKAFVVGGIPHVMAAYAYASQVDETGAFSVIQPTSFLLNLYNVTPTMGSAAHDDMIANIAAKISPDEASPAPAATGRLAGVHQDSSGDYEVALLQNSNYGFESAPYSPYFSPTGVISCKFDFSLTNPDARDLGNNANIASGEVIMYDGASVVEQNFHIYPNSLGFSAISLTGGNVGSPTAESTYGYIYVYEWIDNEGQVHRSFPSPVTTPISPGHDYTFASFGGVPTGSVALIIPMLRVTNKPGTQVVVNIYRTLANGSVYFLLGDAASFGQTYGTVINDPSVDSVIYTDTFGDDTIQGNTQLYTTGALGYFAPPASSVLTTFKNRLLSVPDEGGYNFIYSNQVLPNFPVQFVPFFEQNVGTVGGPIVTMAGMDDKIIIFKSGIISGPSILYMVGQGPSPSGASNDFTDPLPVAVDVGCVDRASVVLTPVGLMFKSDKGIYLLSRSLEASYIGAPVEAYNQYSVVSSQLIPNTTEVRFLLSSGTLLMYDYFYKRWSTFTNPAGLSDCIFQGQHTYAAADGTVYKETPGVYVDGVNTPVLMNFTTSWIKLAGLQGYQRSFFFYLLGEYLSAHQWSIGITYDFNATPAQTTLIAPNTSKSLENWRVFLAKQRCQSFQISLQEIYGGTPGPAFTLSGLNLIVGMKSRFRTIAAAETAG